MSYFKSKLMSLLEYIARLLERLFFRILHSFSIGFKFELLGGRKMTLRPASKRGLITDWQPWYLARSRTTTALSCSMGKSKSLSMTNCLKVSSLLPSLVIMYLTRSYLFEIAPINWTRFRSAVILGGKSYLNLSSADCHVLRLFSHGSQEASSTKMISVFAYQCSKR